MEVIAGVAWVAGALWMIFRPYPELPGDDDDYERRKEARKQYLREQREQDEADAAEARRIQRVINDKIKREARLAQKEKDKETERLRNIKIAKQKQDEKDRKEAERRAKEEADRLEAKRKAEAERKRIEGIQNTDRINFNNEFTNLKGLYTLHNVTLDPETSQTQYEYEINVLNASKNSLIELKSGIEKNIKYYSIKSEIMTSITNFFGDIISLIDRVITASNELKTNNLNKLVSAVNDEKYEINYINDNYIKNIGLKTLKIIETDFATFILSDALDYNGKLVVINAYAKQYKAEPSTTGFITILKEDVMNKNKKTDL